jgi:DNA-binding PadR family transcriptional regulator
MNRLCITNEGLMCINDFRSIQKAILVVLCRGPKRVLELVAEIRREYIEFKYIEQRIIITALGSLIKCNLVQSTYEDDY